jgi:hypothetical protein
MRLGTLSFDLSTGLGALRRFAISDPSLQVGCGKLELAMVVRQPGIVDSYPEKAAPAHADGATILDDSGCDPALTEADSDTITHLESRGGSVTARGVGHRCFYCTTHQGGFPKSPWTASATTRSKTRASRRQLLRQARTELNLRFGFSLEKSW